MHCHVRSSSEAFRWAYKFNGKERDSESGLDMFGARYYGSSLGRFMTPDWAAKPTNVPYAHFGNPQSLNLYSYVQNNPTTVGDPDGHCAEDACIVEGTAAIGAAIYVGGAALLAGTAAVLSTPSGQRSLDTFTSAAGTSISNSITGIKNFFSKSSDSKPAPATPAAGDKQPQPLVGNNPKDGGSRTNTDLPGGHEAATGTFGEQTAGQAVRTDPSTGHQVSEDGSRLRLNPDGTARVDLPNRGSQPNGETVHFNNPDPKPPVPKEPQ